jgi:hypothetical protein
MDKYNEIIRQFVIEYLNDRMFQIQNNFLIMPSTDQIEAAYQNPLGTPFGQQLVEIARAASGEMKDDEEGWNRGVVYEGIQDLMEQLFAPPGLGSAYTIPSEFWEQPLGEMVSRAMLWVQQDELITQAEAAKIRGVSIQAISQAIQLGKLRGFKNPEANERQGRTLVSRKEIEKM